MIFLKMELTCFIILVYLFLSTLRSKRLLTYSYQLFSLSLKVGLAALLLNTASAFMLSHTGTVPDTVGKLCNQLSYIGFITFAALTCCYLLSIGAPAGTIATKKVLLTAPVAVAGLVILVSPYSYQPGAIAYVTGLAPIVCSLAMVGYMLAGIYIMNTYRTDIPDFFRSNLLPALIITAVISLLQLLMPSAAITCAGIVMVSIGMLVSMDSPEKYLSLSGKLFNRFAFNTIMEDWIDQKKSFSCVIVMYTQRDLLAEKFGQEYFEELMLALEQYAKETLSLTMYMPLNGCAAFLLPDISRTEFVMASLTARFEEMWKVRDVPMELTASIHRFDVPSEYSTVDDVMSAIMEVTEDSSVHILEKDKLLGIKNRNAYERDSMALYQDRGHYSSIHYIAADINGLRTINEEYGTVAGDELLKDCAKILTTSAGDGTDVYRMDGDEFGILLTSKTDSEVRSLLDRIQSQREQLNRNREIQLDFAIGYSKFDPNSDRSFGNVMERAMYQMRSQKRHAQLQSNVITTRLGTKLIKF